jgi:hypothetical protein
MIPMLITAPDIIPDIAPKMAQVTMTAEANPPLIGPAQRCAASNKSSAMPEFARIRAINMKSGTAMKTKFCAIVVIVVMIGCSWIRLKNNKLEITAAPPTQKASGSPVKIKINRIIIIMMGDQEVTSNNSIILFLPF